MIAVQVLAVVVGSLAAAVIVGIYVAVWRELGR